MQSAKERASVADKNLQQNKKCKCDQFRQKKTAKQLTKRRQKIRQARNYTYNSKKQKRNHANKQAIEQDKCDNMPKMQN